MTYIKYQNDGEIDINAFRLLGASSKEEDETKIGFWGSGLKYALAVLIRNGIGVKAYSGTKEIKIGTRKTKMRGEEYEAITINGTATSFTTRLGKDWELWFAIREIMANAIDEGSNQHGVADEAKGEKGKTIFFIEFTDALKDIYSDLPRYFSLKRTPIEKTPYGSIYSTHTKEEGIIYRRGFKVGDMNNMLFDYDLPSVKINESRVLESHLDMDLHLTQLWKNHATPYMLERLVSGESYEKNRMDWVWYGVFNNEWLNFLRGKQIIPLEYAGQFTDLLGKPHIQLGQALCKELHKQFKGQLNIAGMTDRGEFLSHKIVEPTEIEKQVIADALAYLLPFLPDIKDISINVAEMEQNRLGEAIDGKILLSRAGLMLGEQKIIGTLLEEYTHIKTGHEDYTRGFQNALLGIAARSIIYANKVAKHHLKNE